MKIWNALRRRKNTLSLSINFARSKYYHFPSPFPGKQLKATATAQIWKIKTVPCIFTAALYMLKIHLFTRKPGKRIYQSKRAIYNNAISKQKQTTALHQGWQWKSEYSLKFPMKILFRFLTITLIPFKIFSQSSGSSKKLVD